MAFRLFKCVKHPDQFIKYHPITDEQTLKDLEDILMKDIDVENRYNFCRSCIQEKGYDHYKDGKQDKMVFVKLK